MQPLLSTSAADISLDLDNNLIFAKWRFAMDYDGFVEAHEVMIEQILTHKFHFLLSDVRESSIITAEQHERIENEFEQRFYEAGLRYIAMIVPSKIFLEMTVSKLIQNYKTGLIVNQVKNPESAYQWFETLKDKGHVRAE